jgi:hypothetical protein
MLFVLVSVLYKTLYLCATQLVQFALYATASCVRTHAFLVLCIPPHQHADVVASRCVYACLCLSVDKHELPIRVEQIADATHTQADEQPTTTAAAPPTVAGSAFVPPSIDLDVDTLVT